MEGMHNCKIATWWSLMTSGNDPIGRELPVIFAIADWPGPYEGPLTAAIEYARSAGCTLTWPDHETPHLAIAALDDAVPHAPWLHGLHIKALEVFQVATVLLHPVPGSAVLLGHIDALYLYTMSQLVHEVPTIRGSLLVSQLDGCNLVAYKQRCSFGFQVRSPTWEG